MPAGLRTLSVLVAGDDPPTEFRIFRRGVNETEKGPIVFDDEAAASVLAHAGAHGVDVMIDLEHLSLDEESPAFDPDARGWCRLEVRDGELWATHVTWTPDGEARLREKRQRYVSPAFWDDDGDPPRVTKICNIALTAMPATHEIPALVAAGSRGRKMNPKKMAKLAKMLRAGVAQDEILTKLAIDIKSLQSVVKAMGGDPGGDLGALMATVAAYAEELAAMARGESAPVEEGPAAVDEPVLESEDAPKEEDEEQMRRTSMRELAKLRAEKEARAKAERDELTKLRREAAERDEAERRSLTVALVRLGGLTPSLAWADDSATRPSAMIAKLSLDDLRGWVTKLGGARVQSAPVPPSVGVTMESGPDVSEYEAMRLSIAAKNAGVDVDVALAKYREIKARQLNTAIRSGGNAARFGRRLEQLDVLASVSGRIGPEEIRTLTNAVRPHEPFGATSQRALEEFRLDLMVNQAIIPDDWTVHFGLQIPGGYGVTTFPLDFSVVNFRERLGQNAAAETPNTRDISLDKREFRAAKQCDLRRLQGGDFAYIKTWQSGPAQMARGKVKLRASLVTTLLQGGTAIYWGQSASQKTGVEGVYYFSASHKINPFNKAITMSGTGGSTWSNYQASGTPFGIANLSAEMDSMLFVPHFDGLVLGTECSSLLLPTSLQGPARRVFDQPFATDGETSSVQIANVHYQSSLRRVHAPQLSGSDATADYYLLSEGTIAEGFFPWVIVEDAEDEIITWDESSDFYKQTNMIKIEEKTYINAALAWPHGIRLVKGA